MRYALFIVFFFSAFISAAQNLKSGGKLNPEQAIMDIRHYTVALTLDPQQQTIDGYTEIDLILSQPAKRLLFDLTQLMQVKKVWVNGKEAKQEQQDNKVFITSASPFDLGKIKVKIAYGGKPAIAERAPWIGGFQWEKDSKGNPWIAITCQGEGAKIFFSLQGPPQR